MRVELLTPDVASPDAPAPSNDAFSTILRDVGQVLESASHAEDAFAAEAGLLQDAVYERARADVAIAVASSAAQRGAQAIQTMLGIQL